MFPFPNNYTSRKVANTASKPCEICYKPSDSVLVTPDNKDFFYVCPNHLKDKGFCSPIVDEAAVQAKRKKEMEAEVERVKQEFEEKQRRKKEKEKAKDAKDKDREKDKVEPDDKTVEEKKIETNSSTQLEEEPRVFALQRTFFQQRIDKKRNAEIAKRNRERVQAPNFFPEVPKGLP